MSLDIWFAGTLQATTVDFFLQFSFTTFLKRRFHEITADRQCKQFFCPRHLRAFEPGMAIAIPAMQQQAADEMANLIDLNVGAGAFRTDQFIR